MHEHCVVQMGNKRHALPRASCQLDRLPERKGGGGSAAATPAGVDDDKQAARTHSLADREEAAWVMCHQPTLTEAQGGPAGGHGAAVPSQLFTDEDPATTIKGMGFKDARAAETTIRLSGQPGCVYKQYWTVKAMAERARHHPHQTPAMRAALAVFERWLNARPAAATGGSRPAVPPVERQQRRLLADSAANAHARSRCSSDAEHNSLVATDRRTALLALRGAARGVPFALPVTAFVSIFGSPGEHGFGLHRCDAAAAAGLAGWRCSCAFRQCHTVTVTSAASLSSSGTAGGAGGKNGGFRSAAFDLVFEGSEKQMASLKAKPAKGQASLTSFFKPSAAAAAAAAAAGPRPSTNDGGEQHRKDGESNIGSIASGAIGGGDGSCCRPNKRARMFWGPS